MDFHQFKVMDLVGQVHIFSLTNIHTFGPNICLIRLFSLMLNYAKPRLINNICIDNIFLYHEDYYVHINELPIEYLSLLFWLNKIMKLNFFLWVQMICAIVFLNYSARIPLIPMKMNCASCYNSKQNQNPVRQLF